MKKMNQKGLIKINLGVLHLLFIGLSTLIAFMSFVVKDHSSARIYALLVLIGIFLLIFSKLKSLGKVSSFSFGTKEMNRIEKLLYYSGYSLIVANTFLIIFEVYFGGP